MNDLTGAWVHVVPAALTAVATVLVWLLFQLSQKAGADTKANKALLVAGRFAHFAGVVVQELNVRMKPMLQAKTADGSLSAQDMADLKAEALRLVKQIAGEQGLTELQEALKIAAPAVDTYLSGLIESKVTEAKVTPAVLVEAATPAPAPAPTVVLPNPLTPR